MTTAAAIARKSNQERCAPGVMPNTLPRSPTNALCGKLSVRMSTFCPVGPDVNRSGPLIAQASRLIAMPFIMIVVTTSWAPVFTFRTAGDACPDHPAEHRGEQDDDHVHRTGEEVQAHGRPCARHHARRSTGPSTPMLNMPPLKQTATARAEKINGVAIASTYPKPSRLPTENRRMAP